MRRDVIDFTRSFSMLMKSGIPILKSLETLYEQMGPSRIKKVTKRLIEDIQEGAFLSEALEHHKNIFPQIYINMVKAGEISGKLAPALRELSDFLQRSRRLKQKIITSLMYPILILVTAVIILAVLMIFVVPTLTNIFKDLGGELPPVTLFLINTSKFLGRWGYLFILLLVLIVVGYNLIKRTPAGAYKINIYRWKLPIIGKFLKDIAIERFSHSLGVMLSSGVPLVKSLLATREVVVDPLLKESIDFLIEKIETGSSLSESMEEARIFPGSLVKIVGVAEDSGRLSSVFLEIAQDYEEDISASLSGIISLLEPLLIIFMGVVVGFIVVGLFFPIFSMGSLIR